MSKAYNTYPHIKKKRIPVMVKGQIDTNTHAGNLNK